MVNTCAVLGCTARSDKNKELSFYRVPIWSAISAKTARTELIMLFLKRAVNGGRFLEEGGRSRALF